jgi:hypothetical protein
MNFLGENVAIAVDEFQTCFSQRLAASAVFTSQLFMPPF